jgi:hypothetical protein
VEGTYGTTYSWLFKGKVGFEDWLSGKTQSPVFWISGKPGSGKSTVMKFAMQHNETKRLLNLYDCSHWVIAGFFFHDRGSVIQKSMDGLLQEVLYQLFSQNPQLIRAVLTSHPPTIEFHQKMGNTEISLSWSYGDIKQALIAIASGYRLNLCLFIDALDEHAGNHHELLDIIETFVSLAENPGFKLRLCLASRPENAFQQAFQHFPGFPIHNWTTLDIQQYAMGMMKEVEKDAPEQFRLLINSITVKARGVFIWVKLVVRELMEGWYEGDNIQELEATLLIIPPELGGLYQRALRRFPRSTSHTKHTYKREAYIMFEIVLRASMPIEIHEFMHVVAFSTSRNPVDQEMTGPRMVQRLYSRCAGLLEVLAMDVIPGQLGEYVQFIHQTAKEYMMSGVGFKELYECVRDMPIENGHTYLLQYQVSSFAGSLSSASHHDVTWGESPLFHAHEAEILSGRPSSNYIESALYKTPRPLMRGDAITILGNIDGLGRFTDSLHQADTQGLGSLLFAAVASLPLSMEICIKRQPSLTKRYGSLLLLAAVLDTREHGIDNMKRSVETFELILKTGMDPDSDFKGQTTFSAIMKNEEDLMRKEPEGLILFLETLLKYGANPDQRISDFPLRGYFAPTVVFLVQNLEPEELLGLVVKFGADTSLLDFDGFSALFYAIAWNETECVQILLDHGANPHRINFLGLSALCPRRELFGDSSLNIDFETFECQSRIMMPLLSEAAWKRL